MLSDSPTAFRSGRILLTGATGYVGSRLLLELERTGRQVRCLSRRPEALSGRTAPGTEVVAGDLLDPESLARALAGIEVAFYLVHSMEGSGDFEAQDRAAAENFATAARAAGLRRIIYLGGLGDDHEALSPHLRSRHEVGERLRGSGVETIELRASIVLGCGSLSFEMIRALVERLPVMVTPRWVSTPCQPLGIADLLRYLTAATSLAPGPSRIYEIGGADRMSYGGLMRAYARQRGLRRWMIPVPVLSPRLSSLWLGLVTPYLARVGRKLVDSLRNPTVVRDESARGAFGFAPATVREAIAQAIAEEDREFASAAYSERLSALGAHGEHVSRMLGARILDSRVLATPAPAAQAFAPIRRIGGATGWYYGDWLWRLRGLLDRALGGPGLRRGRPDPERLAPGDVVDFWKVVAWEPDRRLRLEAEMKLPGRAWLEFEVVPAGAGSTVRQTAAFDARGLLGILYWWSLLPLHHLMFDGMLRQIVRRGIQGTTTAAASLEGTTR